VQGLSARAPFRSSDIGSPQNVIALIGEPPPGAQGSQVARRALVIRSWLDLAQLAEKSASDDWIFRGEPHAGEAPQSRVAR